MKKVSLFLVLVLATSLFTATAAPLADQHILSISTDSLKKVHGFVHNTNYSNIALDSVLTLSSGKYYTDDGGVLRYYQKYNPKFFTIQAKAGVIIQSVKFTYISRNSGTLAKSNTSSVAVADRYESGKTYAVDANSFTCYFGNTGTGTDGRADVTNFEIKYFNPSTGVAVTKYANDLGKDLGLTSGKDYQDIAVNNVINMHAEKTGTLKYFTSGNFNCYRWTGPIEIQAREGVTIHYVKITYNGGPRAVLTKNYGSDGKNIPAANRIASDSILYVNANSLKLYVGDTLPNDGTTSPTLGITKIYVNYTDNNAIVDNFDNCAVQSSDSTVDVVGVDGIYNWKITNFNRDNSRRICYDQSIMLRPGGKIQTVGAEGGVKEVSFDWFASAKDQGVKFDVKVGGEIFSVDSAAMNGYYRITHTEKEIMQNGDFSIEVDAASGSQLEFGHISLIPYLLYTNKAVTVLAKDYEPGFRYTNTDLINNTTGNPVVYTVEGENANQIASVDPSTGELTLLGQGVVTVKASWEEVSTTYTLNVVLEDAGLEFEKSDTTVSALAGTFHQSLSKSTLADVTYSIEGEAGTTSIDKDGIVSFTEAGTLTITAIVAQQLPYLADTAVYTLTILREKPEISFDQDTVIKTVNDEPFVILPITTVGVGDTTFTSSNPEVATIDALTGEVTIVAKGETTIKAEIAQNGVYEAAETSYVLIVDGTPTDLINLTNSSIHRFTKIVKDNQLIIIRDGKSYSVIGETIK